MVQFECPRVIPLGLIHFWKVPLSHFLPLLLPLPTIKKWFIMEGWIKRWTFYGTKYV